MTYEKPQKQNPYGLTVKQHIFPAKSIERFADSNGMVEVKLISQNKVISLPPDDQLFCAKRCWDQRAEEGYQKSIEDSFQALTSKIIDNPTSILGDSDNRVATDFYLLWLLRYERNLSPLPDVQLKGIIGGKPFTKDEEERLEKNHVIFTRGEIPSVPSRFMTGLNIQMSIDKRRSDIGKVQWGVVKSNEGDFIVPEIYFDVAVIPISPNIILLGKSQNIFITRSEVVKVNQLAISFCLNYYFARSLSRCPI